MTVLQRIFSLIIKEFIQLRRDRRSLAMVIAIPLIQLALFGYALSTDIKNISVVVWDSSNTAESRELIESFEVTEFFSINYYATSYDDIASLLDSGAAKVALVIPPDYSKQLHRGEEAAVQLLVDGSDPAVGIQALYYASLIAQAEAVEIVAEQRGGQELTMPVSLQPRVWYNPAMESAIFYLPGLVGVILQMITVMLPAFAIVRERETGTIEQLNVTPLRRGELVVAKLIPYIIIAYAQVILVLTVAILVFGMPMQGSLALLLALTSVFLMVSLGIGLFISTVSRTQFQAMQLSFMVMVPSILLSGFIFPVESMPTVAQWIAALLPLTYFLHIVRGIVVKGVGIEYLWGDVAVLAVMGVLILLLAASRLRKTLA
ncbi:MAG: ABC transporter permease [Dehalococcoidia bacterium]